MAADQLTALANLSGSTLYVMGVLLSAAGEFIVRKTDAYHLNT
jgi:hypothetical protein